MESPSSGNLMNPRSNLERCAESIEVLIHVNGFQRTVSSSDNCDSPSPNSLTYKSLRFAIESSIGQEGSWDANKKRNGVADFPHCNGFLDQTMDDSSSPKCTVHQEHDENLLKAVSSDENSDDGSERDNSEDLYSDDSPKDGCSEARFKGSSSASSQPKAAIFRSLFGSKPLQSSYCARIGDLVGESHDGSSESSFKASVSVDSLQTNFAANCHIPDTNDCYDLKLQDSDDVLTEATSVASSDPQRSSNLIVPCRLSPDLTEYSNRRRFAAIARNQSCEDVSESRFKTSRTVTSLQIPVATNHQMVDISDGCDRDVSDQRLAEPNHNSVDLISANTQGDLNHAEPLSPDVSEYPLPSHELLLEASAHYRKRKFQYSYLGNDTDGQTEKRRKTALENRNRIFGLAAKTVTVNPVAETIQEPDPEEFPDAGCRIPYNGHREDIPHFQLCDIVAAGMCLRKEHSNWLRGGPTDSAGVVNLVMGRSCRRILLNSTCTEVGCSFKHPVDLNLDFPSTQLNTNVTAFTKWFLENAPNPDFKGIWQMLSRLPKDHDDALMIAFSFVKMIPRLKKIYRQALGIKLVEILVKVMNFKPWEAVRTLLVFSVTQETTQEEIEDLICNQRLQNHLFESVSCLWHVSKMFVCPADVLFKLIQECCVKMPEDLKLTKDKIVADLMKLPRRIVLKEFLLIDKFLGKFYPQNSEIAHAVRSRVFYQQDLTSVPRAVSYESSRIKGTGPVNPKWNYWDIREARIEGFQLVLRNTRRSKWAEKSTGAEDATCEVFFENLQDDVTCEELFKILAKKNVLSYKAVPDDNMEPLAESLRAGKYGELVKILVSSCKSDRMVMCLRTLQRELELCEKSKLPAVVFEILRRLQEERFQGTSAGGDFTCSLNSLVLNFYREGDFKSAIKLIKTMRVANVNHMEHVPKDLDQETFSVICSEIHLECRLYSEAIRCLMYKDCLNFAKCEMDSVHFLSLERVVTTMFKTFLKNRLSSHALEIFRLILTTQKSLSSPIDIGRFYEGTLFLSFVRDLKKGACEVGDGANLYILVDRICGNSEKFHSITYRSLLVELHHVRSPEDVVRRTLLLCLKSGAYPNFTSGRFHPLVLNSLLTTDEMAIYLKHYFTYFVAQKVRLDDRPFIVRFIERRPLKKPFPVPNDVMKTPGTVPAALERLKSALQRVSGSTYRELGAEFSADCLTIPVHGVRALLDELKQ